MLEEFERRFHVSHGLGHSVVAARGTAHFQGDVITGSPRAPSQLPPKTHSTALSSFQPVVSTVPLRPAPSSTTVAAPASALVARRSIATNGSFRFAAWTHTFQGTIGFLAVDAQRRVCVEQLHVRVHADPKRPVFRRGRVVADTLGRPLISRSQAPGHPSIQETHQGPACAGL